MDKKFNLTSEDMDAINESIMDNFVLAMESSADDDYDEDDEDDYEDECEGCDDAADECDEDDDEDYDEDDEDDYEDEVNDTDPDDEYDPEIDDDEDPAEDDDDEYDDVVESAGMANLEDIIDPIEFTTAHEAWLEETYRALDIAMEDADDTINSDEPTPKSDDDDGDGIADDLENRSVKVKQFNTVFDKDPDFENESAADVLGIFDDDEYDEDDDDDIDLV